MAENKLPYTHLLYVSKYSILTNDYEFYVYGVKTDDIFHTMGEFLYRNIEQVKRIDQVECTQSRLDYWASKNQKIYTFHDKYPVNKNK